MRSVGRREHPRLRGEKGSRPEKQGTSPGTPPPALGEGRHRGSGRVVEGNTPACAGRSRPDQRRDGAGREHPRLRGEKIAPAT